MNMYVYNFYIVLLANCIIGISAHYYYDNLEMIASVTVDGYNDFVVVFQISKCINDIYKYHIYFVYNKAIKH